MKGDALRFSGAIQAVGVDTAVLDAVPKSHEAGGVTYLREDRAWRRFYAPRRHGYRRPRRR